jgi:acetate kinase
MRSILTLNAGSSSLKFALFSEDGLDCVAIGLVEGLGTDPNLVVKDGKGNLLLSDTLEGDRFVADHPGALKTVLAALATLVPDAEIAAIGHRVVHGGMRFASPVAVDDEILAVLARFIPLAPLHQPHNLAGIAAVSQLFPGKPQVACFDTAFHRSHPFVSDTYGLPRRFYDEGVRRYGFHGLSYEYVVSRLREVAPRLAAGRTVICHLGSGASMCAVKAGRSVASTMGFSALDGLLMGTRPGQLDPGVLLYLMEQKSMTAKAIADFLYKECGLKGMSGISNDMRDLEASTAPEAQEAIDYFVHRIRREIGAMVVDLDGLDGIVFCGGIGENSSDIRAAILNGLSCLGVEIDADQNKAGSGLISKDGQAIEAHVVRTNEELMIARHTRNVVSGEQAVT